ncbi:MAG: hypothetical protein WA989_14225 [Henriciella sp.]|uniref:hypothetical protein n=1 Tax=Henriciella sp. TaxID=1968823 RepID=UPI003C7932A9
MTLFEYEPGETPKTGSKHGAVLATFGVGLIFLLWLIAGGYAVRTAAQQTPEFARLDPHIRQKLAGIDPEEAHDVVWLGTSRIFRQIDAGALSERCGADMYNAGAGGANAANIRFMLDWMLDQPSQPRTIWIEPTGVANAGIPRTARARYLAPDWQPAYLRSSLLDAERAEDVSESELQYDIFLHSISSFFLTGVVHELVKERPLESIDNIGVRGFTRLDADGGRRNPRAAKLQRLLEEDPDLFQAYFEDQAAALGGLSQDDAAADALNFARPILSGLTTEELSRVGLIFPPKSGHSQLPLTELTVRGVDIPVLTFPLADHGFLADSDYWFDEGHLSGEGADLLAQSIARRICGAG